MAHVCAAALLLCRSRNVTLLHITYHYINTKANALPLSICCLVGQWRACVRLGRSVHKPRGQHERVCMCVCALAVRQKSASPTTLVSPRCVPGAGMDLTLTVQATLISPQRSHSATSADNGRLCEGSADGRSGFVGVFFSRTRRYLKVFRSAHSIAERNAKSQSAAATSAFVGELSRERSLRPSLSDSFQLTLPGLRMRELIRRVDFLAPLAHTHTCNLSHT